MGVWGPKKTIIRAVGAAVMLGVAYVGILWLTLPDISNPKTLLASQSSVITDRNGVELYRLYDEENRTFIDSKLIPDSLKHAIVSIEDERFYDRGCIDFQALARVFISFGQSGGASTLTRQLARNALDLKQENIVSRKVKEMILGCQLENHYSKDDLLSLYLNWIPFGQNAYGVEQASHTYFSVSAKDLTLAQSAVLAALPQRPSYFTPYGKHVRTTVTDAVKTKILSGKITKASQISDDDITIGLLGNHIGSGSTMVYVGGRTDQVLKNMQDFGYITEEQRTKALADYDLMKFSPLRESIRAPHFVLWIRKQVEAMYPGTSSLLEQGGLTIETTLDWNLQKAAEDTVKFYKDDFAKRFNARNIALVSLDAKSGEILSYVGNSDYDDTAQDTKIDMARVPRQPGSSFKPIVYAAAFEQGYGPATVLADVPTSFGGDDPQNFDGDFWGLLSARKAIGGSRNIPAAKAFFLAGGEEKVLSMATRLGAVTPAQTWEQQRAKNPDFSYGWPLAIGSAETPLLEMTNAYATLANAGVYMPTVSLKKITDRNGAILFEAKPAVPGSPTVDPRIAYEVTSMISDTSARPNEYWQNVLNVPGYQTAAKTGTSNKCLERQSNGNCTKRRPEGLWTLGYTPGLVTGVWIGNASSEALAEKAESLSAASPLWKEYMTRAHKFLKNVPTSFTQPSGMVELQVSTLSGLLPAPCTPIADRTTEIFLEENIPKEQDSACAMLKIDKVTGLLASPACPVDAQEESAFFVPKSVAADRWPGWQQGLVDWATKQMAGWTADPASHSGSLLPLPLAPTQACDPSLTPGRLQKPTITITTPARNGMATYPAFRPQFQKNTGSDIHDITWTIDGKTVAVWGSGGTIDQSILVPRSVSKDGNHTLGVTLTDKYFNKATDSVPFHFGQDTVGPTVNWSKPNTVSDAKTGTTIQLAAKAEDADSGIKYVQFYLDDTLLSTKPQAPYELSYPIKEPAGTYTLKVKAIDFAGNSSVAEVVLNVTE